MGICLSFLTRLPCPLNEFEGFKTFNAGFIFLITEENVNPFGKAIENALTKHNKTIVKLELQQSLEKIQEDQNNSAIVIRDAQYRQQEIDNQLIQLGTKLKNVLIFHILPDEYSQRTLVSSEHIQQATLHRTHGSCISRQDQIIIQKTIHKFISKAQE